MSALAECVAYGEVVKNIRDDESGGQTNKSAPKKPILKQKSPIGISDQCDERQAKRKRQDIEKGELDCRFGDLGIECKDPFRIGIVVLVGHDARARRKADLADLACHAKRGGEEECHPSSAESEVCNHGGDQTEDRHTDGDQGEIFIFPTVAVQHEAELSVAFCFLSGGGLLRLGGEPFGVISFSAQKLVGRDAENFRNRGYQGKLGCAFVTLPTADRLIRNEELFSKLPLRHTACPSQCRYEFSNRFLFHVYLRSADVRH